MHILKFLNFCYSINQPDKTVKNYNRLRNEVSVRYAEKHLCQTLRPLCIFTCLQCVSFPFKWHVPKIYIFGIKILNCLTWISIPTAAQIITTKSLTVYGEGAEHRLYQERFLSSSDLFHNAHTTDTKCHRDTKIWKGRHTPTVKRNTTQWKDKTRWKHFVQLWFKNLSGPQGSLVVIAAHEEHQTRKPVKCADLKKIMPLAESRLWCHTHSATMKQMTPLFMYSKRNGSLCTDQYFFIFNIQGQSIYCKSTICFRQHNNIMVHLLNFNIKYIIILATCFDSYESSSGINFKNYCTYCLTVFV